MLPAEHAEHAEHTEETEYALCMVNTAATPEGGGTQGTRLLSEVTEAFPLKAVQSPFDRG